MTDIVTGQESPPIPLAYVLGTQLLSYAGADREQAKWLSGILSVDRAKRREHGAKLHKCIEDLAANGVTWGGEQVGVWRGGGSGVLKDSINIPLRLARWLRFAIFSENEFDKNGLDQARRELKAYADSGRHRFAQRPLVIRDVPKLVLPFAEKAS
jgi:hypothetical protein